MIVVEVNGVPEEAGREQRIVDGETLDALGWRSAQRSITVAAKAFLLFDIGQPGLAPLALRELVVVTG
jgi:hypothetical protein